MGNEGVYEDILLLYVVILSLVIGGRNWRPKLPYLSVLWLIGLMFTLCGMMSFRFLGFHKIWNITDTQILSDGIYARAVRRKTHCWRKFHQSERRPSRRRCIIKARRYKYNNFITAKFYRLTIYNKVIDAICVLGLKVSKKWNVNLDHLHIVGIRHFWIRQLSNIKCVVARNKTVQKLIVFIKHFCLAEQNSSCIFGIRKYV